MKMRVISRGMDKKPYVKNKVKKNPLDFEKLEVEFYENMKNKNLSYNLCNYVWKVLIGTQRGYGLNFIKLDPLYGNI